MGGSGHLWSMLGLHSFFDTFATLFWEALCLCVQELVRYGVQEILWWLNFFLALTCELAAVCFTYRQSVGHCGNVAKCTAMCWSLRFPIFGYCKTDVLTFFMMNNPF